MISSCHEFAIKTNGYSQTLDITAQVQGIVDEQGLGEGLATVFVPGATASVTTIEFEPGAVADLGECVEAIAPSDRDYKHDARWGDGNGFAHLRAALLGPSLCVPVSQARLCLGTWQQIVLMDHDNRHRQRRVLVQVMGKAKP